MNPCKNKHTEMHFIVVIHKSQQLKKKKKRKEKRNNSTNSHLSGQTYTVIPRMPENYRDVGRLYSNSLLNFTVSKPLSD